MKRLIVFLFSLICSISVYTQSYTTTSNLRMRYGPGTNYPAIKTIPKGYKVTVLYKDGIWWRIQQGNNYGYVNSRYLQQISKREVNTRHKSNFSNRNHAYNSRSYYNGYSETGHRFNGGNTGYYTNTYGETVKRPSYQRSVPADASAVCRDGTYSYSRSRRGTCSHHGGVAEWLY